MREENKESNRKFQVSHDWGRVCVSVCVTDVTIYVTSLGLWFQTVSRHAQQQVQAEINNDGTVWLSLLPLSCQSGCDRGCTWSDYDLPTLFFCSWWQQVCNPAGKAGVIWHDAGEVTEPPATAVRSFLGFYAFVWTGNCLLLSRQSTQSEITPSAVYFHTLIPNIDAFEEETWTDTWNGEWGLHRPCKYSFTSSRS